MSNSSNKGSSISLVDYRQGNHHCRASISKKNHGTVQVTLPKDQAQMFRYGTPGHGHVHVYKSGLCLPISLPAKEYDKSTSTLTFSRRPAHVHELSHQFATERLASIRGVNLIHAPMSFIPRTTLLAAEPDSYIPKEDTLMAVAGMNNNSPSITSIAIIDGSDKGIDSQELRMVEDLLTIQSYVTLQATLHVDSQTRQLQRTLDMTKPEDAAFYNQTMSQGAFNAVHKDLAGAFGLDSSTSEQFTRHTNSTNLHSEFLKEMFSSFSLGEDSTRKLDGILTGIASRMAQFGGDVTSQTDHLEHLLMIPYFGTFPGSEIKIMKFRIFYLHIDTQSFKFSGKNDSFEQNFNMNYEDLTLTINPAIWPQIRGGISNTLSTYLPTSLTQFRNTNPMGTVVKPPLTIPRR